MIKEVNGKMKETKNPNVFVDEEGMLYALDLNKYTGKYFLEKLTELKKEE